MSWLTCNIKLHAFKNVTQDGKVPLLARELNFYFPVFQLEIEDDIDLSDVELDDLDTGKEEL